MMQMPKAYEPQSVEANWNQFWLDQQCFAADPARASAKRPAYSIGRLTRCFTRITRIIANEGKGADACERLTDAHLKQVLNYLAVSKLKLGLLVNFGEDSLVWKRVVLEKRSGSRPDLQK